MHILTAFYDFAVSPASYDFLKFLAGAESYRRAHNYDHMHVMFVPAPNETKFRIDQKPTTTQNKHWRLHNLCVPLCRLYGATYAVFNDQPHENFKVNFPAYPEGWEPGMQENAYWFAKVRAVIEEFGLAVPEVEPEAEQFVKNALGGQSYVTITLRDTYSPVCNSDRAAWTKFAAWLRAQGQYVVVIPDTEHACDSDNQADRLPVANIAAINPLIRHSLYAGAKMNLGIGGGPLCHCWFGGLPFISFKMIRDQYNAFPEFYRKWGLPVGEQFPWAADKQWIQWDGSDTFENIKATYERVMNRERVAA